MSASSGVGLFRFSGLLVFLALGACVVLSTRWLVGDVNHYSVIPVMDAWGEQGAVTSLDEWEGVNRTLEFSQRLDASEPEYYRLQGLAYDWRGFAIEGEEIAAGDLMAARRNALGAYREMAHKRPADPAGWAHLARLKIMAGERDDEFTLAIRNALVLGESRPAVLEEVAYAVSLGWSVVRDDEELKKLVGERVCPFLGEGVGGEIGVFCGR